MHMLHDDVSFSFKSKFKSSSWKWYIYKMKWNFA